MWCLVVEVGSAWMWYLTITPRTSPLPPTLLQRRGDEAGAHTAALAPAASNEAAGHWSSVSEIHQCIPFLARERLPTV